MIVIGVDTHKRSHTLVALDAATGGVRGQLKIAATDDGTLEALRLPRSSTPSACGRSRTAGTCPAGWSAGFSLATSPGKNRGV